MTEQDKKKTELLQTLRDVARDGQELASKGRQITQQGQLISDIARHNKEFIKCIPDDTFLKPAKWDNHISTWQNLHNRADAAKEKVGEVKPLIFAAESSAMSSVSMISSEIIESLPASKQTQAWAVHEGFEQFLEQSDLIQEIDVEIHRLGLATSSAGNESTLSLLGQAKAAFKTPSVAEVATSAVLIPLREAINHVIADLLQKRPHQEKTGGDGKKVQSICKQCCHFDVDNTLINQLASEADELKNILSEAKQASLTRDQVRERMNRGFIFLRAFLRTLDKQKMRVQS